MSRSTRAAGSFLLALGLAVLAEPASAVGSGAFAAHPITPGFGGAGRMVRLGDLNADGRPDAVVAGNVSSTIWISDGSGNFSPHPGTPSIGAGGSVALGDVNGDGRVDLVVSGSVWLGTLTGFTHSSTFGSPGQVALGDIDGDGDLDALLDGTVWRNNGAGSFSAHPATPSFSAVAFTSVNLGDLDGNGSLDVVATGNELVYVFVNDGSGNFTAHSTTPTIGTPSANKSMQQAALGDLDGDGDLDVLAILTDLAGGSSLNLVLRNGGTGNLTLATSFAGNTRVALGDLDGDGDRDALTDTATGVWRNSGAAAFTAHPTPTDFGSAVTSFALADIDGDGDLDALVSNDPGSTAVWVNVNAGSYGITVTASPSAGGSASCSPNPVTSGGSSTCTATASAGYTFTGWSGNCSGTTCTLANVTSPKAVTANFTLNAYPITTAVSPAGGGTVQCTNNPVSHGGSSTCTATPNAGYTFASWSGDCTGNTCALANVTSAKSVTANFTATTYTVTTAANPPSGGTVSCSPNPVPHGGTTTCTASANAGFAFAGWSGACTGTTCVISNVTSPRSVTAAFSAIDPGPPRLSNISTRAHVLTGDDVMIGGFIIGGSAPKTVVIRARGPSMASLGVPGTLANPLLQLFSGSTQVLVNDNWSDAANAAQVQSSGFAPGHPLESAILTTLDPGPYTAIVTGLGGTTGIGIVEVFEIDAPDTPLLNIATRARVQTGDDVMIAGFIVQGSGPQTVVVRARGPSLTQQGVPGVLANPLLQLFSGSTQIAVNDNWGDAGNAAAIQSSGFAPSDPNESAILVTLDPGAYTAIVTGVGGTSGIAIVEVFAVP